MKKHVKFNLLERGSTIKSGVREALIASKQKIIDPTDPRNMIVIPELTIQLALGLRGLIAGTTLDILGPDGIGKSTLLYRMLGWAVSQNSMGLHIETENKPMMEERILRCLHPNRDMAARMLEHGIERHQAFDVISAFDRAQSWAAKVRDMSNPKTYIPHSIPIVIGIDTFSKLQSLSEAQGRQNYDKQLSASSKPKKEYKSNKEKEKEEKAEKIKGLTEGSNFEHAKYLQKFMRIFPQWSHDFNVILIFIRHVNDKIAMVTGGGGMVLTEDQQAKRNRTSIGGKALNQSAAYQLVLSICGMTKMGVRHGEQVKLMQPIEATVVKNSYSAARSFKYGLTFHADDDTEELQTMALDFSTSLPYALKGTGLAQVTIKNSMEVSCKELKANLVTPQELSHLVHSNPEFMESIASRSGVVGYGKSGFIIQDALPDETSSPEPSKSRDPAPPETSDPSAEDAPEEIATTTESEVQAEPDAAGSPKPVTAPRARPTRKSK